MTYSSRDMKTFKTSSRKTKKINKKKTFFGFYLSEGYKYLRIPIVNTFLQSSWGARSTLYDQWFTSYEKSYNFVIIRHRKTKKIIFRALSIAWWVYISETIHSKSSLAVILSGQPIWVSRALHYNQQVNPLNRTSKDWKTTAVLEFATIGRSPLDWSLNICVCDTIKHLTNSDMS